LPLSFCFGKKESDLSQKTRAERLTRKENEEILNKEEH
jgi:hypothetical protein